MAVAATLGLLATAALAAVCWHGDGPVLFDSPVRSWLALRPGPSPARRLAGDIVRIGSPNHQVVAGAVVAGLVLIVLRDIPWALICLAGPALAGLAEVLMKVAVARTWLGVAPGAEYFFPSGHATGISSRLTAIVLVVFAASAGPAVRSVATLTAVAASLAMAASLVVLNDHYPTDTVGGLLLGSSVTVLVAWLVAGRLSTRRGSG